ncbi:hypothetical protein ACFFX1_35345 [Dactylosporangium sucinum]|uniref:Uncharacterized protein n=1 Tax=Dactylosporangium sucinum TaxID=1424081 RepID=A0A917U8Z0_9ACTN|nr:hypothetical protein [Dactylosporangium sucinum]GGM65995.1 hypothetical protein GCM10007977_079480 [Dactylosporangium sucinum]
MTGVAIVRHVYGSIAVPRIKGRLAVILSLVAVAAVATPLAVAQAEEHETPPPGAADLGNLTPGKIDLTGGTPAPALGGEQQLADGAGAAAVPTTLPGLSICRKYRILSISANRYIAEEQNYGGSLHNVLRARTPGESVGGWEIFNICSQNGGGVVYVIAPSGAVVAAEFGYTGTSFAALRGRSQSIATWETFDVWQDGTSYFLRNVARGTFWTCRRDYTGSAYNMMKGSGASGGSWEALRFEAV